MIHRGFLAVDPTLLAWVLGTSKSTRGARMSVTGDAWHWQGTEGKEYPEPFLKTAVELAGESSPPVRVRWWANVLFPGAAYRAHKHDGKWAFVYHLTGGAPLYFEGGERFEATPGQILVFDANLAHWTDKVSGEPRVSIAGNLHFNPKFCARDR